MNNKPLVFGLLILALVVACCVSLGVLTLAVSKREKGSVIDEIYTDSVFEDIVEKITGRVSTSDDEDKDTEKDDNNDIEPTIKPTKVSTVQPTENPTPASTKKPEPKNGFISGSVSYPSEYIPPGLAVCAENDFIVDAFCTAEITSGAGPMSGYTYELEVPPGSYYVYSFDPEAGDAYQAYYSEFVTCGLSIECPSHDPILVTVKAGQKVEGIDPGDWYK